MHLPSIYHTHPTRQKRDSKSQIAVFPLEAVLLLLLVAAVMTHHYDFVLLLVVMMMMMMIVGTVMLLVVCVQPQILQLPHFDRLGQR